VSQPLPNETAASSLASQGGLGEILRRAREERRSSIAECAARLRIRAPYLVALEAGQYDALPGLTYCVGFVKTYAEFLDLDGPEMVQRFKAEAAGLALQPNLTLPSPAPAGRIPGGGPLTVAVVAVLAMVGGWVFLADDPRVMQIRIPDLPERFASMIQQSAPSSPPSPAALIALPPDVSPSSSISPSPAVTSSSPSIPASPSPITPIEATPIQAAPASAGVATVPAQEAPVPAAPTPPVLAALAPVSAPPVIAAPPPSLQSASSADEGRTPAPQALGGAVPLASTTTEEPPRAPPSLAITAPTQPEGRIFGGQNIDARVVLKSNGESWVQIRDRDNSTVFTRLLSAGDSFLVPNRNGLTLWTGNAGVLEVTVDGSIAPSLGAPGSVKKNVSLDADRLRAGTAVGE
jgi:cytoskeleton protein RodZ